MQRGRAGTGSTNFLSSLIFDLCSHWLQTAQLVTDVKIALSVFSVCKHFVHPVLDELKNQ